APADLQSDARVGGQVTVQGHLDGVVAGPQVDQDAAGLPCTEAVDQGVGDGIVAPPSADTNTGNGASAAVVEQLAVNGNADAAGSVVAGIGDRDVVCGIVTQDQDGPGALTHDAGGNTTIFEGFQTGTERCVPAAPRGSVSHETSFIETKGK